jgi:hypothetical protein
VSSAVGLAAVEFVLRSVRENIESSDRLEEGLFTYHPVLGWALTADWRGRHRHADFDVVYTTNADGHRGTPAPPTCATPATAASAICSLPTRGISPPPATACWPNGSPPP